MGGQVLGKKRKARGRGKGERKREEGCGRERNEGKRGFDLPTPVLIIVERRCAKGLLFFGGWEQCFSVAAPISRRKGKFKRSKRGESSSWLALERCPP